MSFRDKKEKFIKNIQRQVVLFSELKDIVLKEQQILKTGKTGTLDEVVKKEEEITGEIKQLEDNKYTLLREMALEAGVEKKRDIKLNDLLKKMNKSDAAEIRGAVEELMGKVKEIGGVNSENTHIIKNFLDYDKFTREAEEKTRKSGQTVYTASGTKKTKTSPRKPRIDTTI